jgi:hypothetical protein
MDEPWTGNGDAGSGTSSCWPERAETRAVHSDLPPASAVAVSSSSEEPSDKSKRVDLLPVFKDESQPMGTP